MKNFIIIFYFSIILCDEVSIREIKLFGHITNEEEEISGMDWYQDKLILLPENLGGYVYSIPKRKIWEYLTIEKPNPINPDKMIFKTVDYSKIIPGFEGFESIVFHNEIVALTIEAKKDNLMAGYFIWGNINLETNKINIPEKNIIELPIPVQIDNFTFESLLIQNDEAIVIFEANGRNLRSNAWQYSISINDQKIKKISHPNIEYRINDVTKLDENNTYWGINYLWEGDLERLKPAEDFLLPDYQTKGIETDIRSIERLTEFKINNSSIELTERAPIQIAINSKLSRNWEGVVRLDRQGFLIATDKYPRMILGFVPLNQ
tara:strand:+ start:8881 stop:9840 length:960 start_codon:yes stop_codon:yes gene_type:complete